MYRVYCDGNLLYHSKLENLKIFYPSVELELNKTGSFEFGIYPDHPYFGLIHKLRSIITVWQDEYLLFRGRVLDDDSGWHNQKNIVCEGELAFLLDSIQRPTVFNGSVAEYLAMLIEIHNAQVDAGKRFVLGNVTVDGVLSVDEGEYLDTFEHIKKQLLDVFGGYLLTRHEGDIVYIDYLSEITLLSPQKISFGKNLLDLKRIRKGADIATVIIPLGAKLKDEEGTETGKRLTIEAVNGGVDFVQDSAAIAEFGTIVKTVIFEDIADAAELKAAGEAYLADSVNLWETIELSAADLATVNKDATSFHLGTQVQVKSKPHGIDHLFIVSRLAVKLLDPAANAITLGKTIPSLSTAIKGISAGVTAIAESLEKNEQHTSEALYNVQQNLEANIQVAADNIKSSVSENYYLKDDTDALISSVSTAIQQTKDSVEIEFSTFRADIQSVAANADAEFEEIRKYIRFVDGMILLGEEGNLLELQISNDRISFLQDGVEVAYFSNRKLYVTDAEFLHTLQLGNFAFMPRANGNLSFKKLN